MIKKMPKKIYIQIEDQVGEFEDLGEATWCVDRINDSDIEYILSDHQVKNQDKNTLKEI